MEEIIKKFNKAQDSLVTQQSDFSLSAIFDMVDNESIDIAPHYQRRDRWSADKQSALIESFLLNVPVPPVYLSEEDYGVYTVIDGKQRITAIADFLSGKLRLVDLKEMPELNGFSFEKLPSQLKNALRVRPFIRVITLLKQSDPELKYEVFLRLNTGGEKLKPQEIRNVAYSGQLNNLLIELSENTFLKQQMKITSIKSAAYRNMDDLELVLRYFTVKAEWQHLSNKLSIAMDSYMAEHRHGPVVQLKDDFIRSIVGCERIWGNHAFQKPTLPGWRDQLIAPLFDAEMVAVSRIDDARIDLLAQHRDLVLDGTANLYTHNQVFIKAATQATGDASAVKNRIEEMTSMLNSIEV